MGYDDKMLSDLRRRFNGAAVLPEALFVLESLGKLNRQGIEKMAVYADTLIASGSYKPNTVNLDWARK